MARCAGLLQQERAVPALAEALTCSHELDLARAQAAASAGFSGEALEPLEWVIVAINSFNRVSIASGLPPRRRKN